MTIRQIAEHIPGRLATDKESLPLLKLAAFGDDRTDKGSLRHNANVVSVSGVEGDYDAGDVTPDDAAELLRAAGVAALIYTTPSHGQKGNRWRVLAPLSVDMSPEARERFTAALNGALGGILSDESFKLSQPMHYGGLKGQTAVQTILVDGNYLDRLPVLPRLGKGGKPWAPRLRTDDLEDLLGKEPAPPVDLSKVQRALEFIPPDCSRDEWIKVGMALHDAGAPFEKWDEWSKCGEKYKPRETPGQWRSFARCERVTIGTLFHIAAGYGWRDSIEIFEDDFEDLPPLENSSRLSFLSPAECEAAPARGYLVKGLFAPRDVACIFGAPGAGKSLLAPFLGYSVAQGQEAFGMRTKAGGVFYVAAEDPHGMRGRVKALKINNGDAPNFFLVEGVSNLLAPGSEDLAALVEAVKERRPALIFLDTLAMAFPGLEENSAESMGRVVKVARRLTKWGAAVVLIHHDTKAEGETPRGHSVLNGALDVALLVKRDGSGVIRGKLTKNRNGPCDRDLAFRIETEDGGTDEDGDMITLPRCEPLASDGVPLKSNASGHAVVRALSKWQRNETDATQMPEAELREACCQPGIVSDAESRESRLRAYRRAFKRLAGQGVLHVSVRPDTGKEAVFLNPLVHLEQFDAKPGQPGQHPDNRDMSPSASTRATRTDTDTPLKGCPVSGSGQHPDELGRE